MATRFYRGRAALVDFATIYSKAWYRDFPFDRDRSQRARPADWTIHIGVAVRSTADLMGLFTRFESGGRTDAILRQNNGHDVALLEWEWTALHFGKQKINEVENLKAKCKAAASQGKPVQFAGFFGYSRSDIRRDVTDFAKLSQTVLNGYTKG